MDKERRDYLRGFATSRNVVSMSPETVVELLDALKAATERAERAERERDEERHALAVVLDEANARIRDDFYRDAWRCLVARVDCDGGQRMMEDEDEAVTTERIDREIARLLGVERERDEARAERDARPEITAEDAAGYMRDEDSDTYHQYGPRVRVEQALRAHAAKAKERP